MSGVREELGGARVRRPDLINIMQYSYACGLTRHWKETRMLVDYIEYLESRINNTAKEETHEQQTV